MSIASLTRTQTEALDHLRRARCLWPSGRGRFAVSGAGKTYSQTTLNALVDAGYARWEHRHGVMPHVVRADEPLVEAPTCQTYSHANRPAQVEAEQRTKVTALLDEWRARADKLDSNQDPACYDPEGERDESMAEVYRECANDLALIVSAGALT